MKKYIIISIIIIAILLAGVGLAYLELGNLWDKNASIISTTTPPVTGEVACMEEAIQCSDGTLVSRSGPNCDFEACPSTPVIPPESVACTMEAKQCPDGSYVGRSGPKCEFSPCLNVTEKNCPQLAPISPDFCPNGKIEFGGVNADGCQLPPKCVN